MELRAIDYTPVVNDIKSHAEKYGLKMSWHWGRTFEITLRGKSAMLKKLTSIFRQLTTEKCITFHSFGNQKIPRFYQKQQEHFRNMCVKCVN